MTSYSQPPPISLRRRGSLATQQGRDDAAHSQGPAHPSLLPFPAGAGKLSGRTGEPSQPSPSQQVKTSPQSRTAKPGWRIVYRKDPADLAKMGTGSKPPVWIAGEEWGCPFRINEITVVAITDEDNDSEPTTLHRGWTVSWYRTGLGIERPEPTADLFHPATYFDRREAQKAAQRAFRDWLGHPDQAGVRQKTRDGLRGRRLACLCGRKSPCHGDVLLKIANEQ